MVEDKDNDEIKRRLLLELKNKNEQDKLMEIKSKSSFLDWITEIIKSFFEITSDIITSIAEFFWNLFFGQKENDKR